MPPWPTLEEETSALFPGFDPEQAGKDAPALTPQRPSSIHPAHPAGIPMRAARNHGLAIAYQCYITGLDGLEGVD
jgi:hypothetical protein